MLFFFSAKSQSNRVKTRVFDFSLSLLFYISIENRNNAEYMKEKVAVITGASSGIGRASALAFAREGANVIAVGRNESEMNALRDEARDFDGSIKPHLADVTESSQMDRLISETIDQFGRIDVLVNSAGVIKSGSIETTTLDEWDKMMNINLRALFSLMQKCVPHLEATKGNIVNVSSVTGTRAFPGSWRTAFRRRGPIS